MSRLIEDLIPIMQQKAIDVLNQCNNDGYPITIYSTRRTLQEQAKYYRQGRTWDEIELKMRRLTRVGFDFLAKIINDVGPQIEKHKITNAGPGESWHNYGEAFDAAPLVDGKIDWKNEDLWQRYGQSVIKYGLIWGGSWTDFVDKPHAQYRPGGNPLRLYNPDQIKNLLIKNKAI